MPQIERGGDRENLLSTAEDTLQAVICSGSPMKLTPWHHFQWFLFNRISSE